MAVGASTLTAAGGAVQDLFAGFGAQDQGALKATGLRITAAGTQEQAESTRIGAEGTRLSAQSLRIKAGGDIAEASNYDLAATLARGNEDYTEMSTRLQEAQTARNITQTVGGIRASVAGAGFTAGGSSLDILRDSSSQGALALAVNRMQGNITEAGFEEQAQSYTTMANAGRTTAAGEMGIADQTDVIAGRQDQLATRQDAIAQQQLGLADQTQAAADKAATGDFISAAFKGAAAIASIGLAPFTGGASLALDGVLEGGAALGQGGIGHA